jgi:hypothetical protein
MQVSHQNRGTHSYSYARSHCTVQEKPFQPVLSLSFPSVLIGLGGGGVPNKEHLSTEYIFLLYETGLECLPAQLERTLQLYC